MKSTLPIIILLTILTSLSSCTLPSAESAVTPSQAVAETISETATRKPSATPIPTEKPTPTIEPSPTPKPIPSLNIPAATICRKMPSEYGIFAHGISKDAQLDLLGKDATENWFLVVNPGSSGGKTCWIASRNVELIGDLEDVPYSSAVQ